MTPRLWESVVRLPRWTADMEAAAQRAGIQAAAHDGRTEHHTTVGMVVEADSLAAAMLRVQRALKPCGVDVQPSDFGGSFRGHD